MAIRNVAKVWIQIESAATGTQQRATITSNTAPDAGPYTRNDAGFQFVAEFAPNLPGAPTGIGAVIEHLQQYHYPAHTHALAIESAVDHGATYIHGGVRFNLNGTRSEVQ